MSKILVALPSDHPGGLDAELSGHFGHCDVFTLVKIEDENVADVTTLPSVPHQQGGCMAPVNHLADNKVNILIAGGMGMRPLMGFQSAGIDVYHCNKLMKNSEIVDAFINGRLSKFTSENTCGGGGDC